MCGLVAAFGDESADRFGLGQDLARGLAAIRHRGPAHHAVWCSVDGRFGLGHARLSIIGLAHGEQPLRNAAGDVRCVVNGELYEYRRIRDQFEATGVPMRTDSDSEIALHLYEKHGDAFVDHLRGEFAVVVADERRGRMVAVRDRFGVNPLYYARHDNRVLFASELKALFAMRVPPDGTPTPFWPSCTGCCPQTAPCSPASGPSRLVAWRWRGRPAADPALLGHRLPDSTGIGERQAHRH